MSQEPRFGRMIPAMVTPFDQDRELDLDRTQELAVRLVDGGSDALIISGTTGESPTVFYPQKMKLFAAVVEAVGDRAPVIANVGDNCTADTADFARDVEKLGVDGFMCVVPVLQQAAAGRPLPALPHHRRKRWSCPSCCTTSPAAAW